MDEDEKVRRAIDRRSRPHRGPFEFGEYVYHCRKYPRDGSVGRWYGSRVIIGKHGDSRLWVAVGTKVLKSALEQLRKTTVDQEAAVRMVSPDLVSRKRGSQGSQVYTDISNERFPPNYVDEPIEGTNTGAAGHGAGYADRKRKLDQTSAEESDETADYEPSPNEAALEPIPEEDRDGSEGMETRESIITGTRDASCEFKEGIQCQFRMSQRQQHGVMHRQLMARWGGNPPDKVLLGMALIDLRHRLLPKPTSKEPFTGVWRS